MALGIALPLGSRKRLFLMSQVPLSAPKQYSLSGGARHTRTPPPTESYLICNLVFCGLFLAILALSEPHHRTKPPKSTPT